MVSVGANGKMNEFCAIMGLCNLNHVEEAIAWRKALCEEYEGQLKGVPGIRLFENKPEVKRNYGYFPILVEDEYPLNRDELYEKLKGQGDLYQEVFLSADFGSGLLYESVSGCGAGQCKKAGWAGVGIAGV